MDLLPPVFNTHFLKCTLKKWNEIECLAQVGKTECINKGKMWNKSKVEDLSQSSGYRGEANTALLQVATRAQLSNRFKHVDNKRMWHTGKRKVAGHPHHGSTLVPPDRVGCCQDGDSGAARSELQCLSSETYRWRHRGYVHYSQSMIMMQVTPVTNISTDVMLQHLFFFPLHHW